MIRRARPSPQQSQLFDARVQKALENFRACFAPKDSWNLPLRLSKTVEQALESLEQLSSWGQANEKKLARELIHGAMRTLAIEAMNEHRIGTKKWIPPAMVLQRIEDRHVKNIEIIIDEDRRLLVRSLDDPETEFAYLVLESDKASATNTP
jgi:hypothetical protein